MSYFYYIKDYYASIVPLKTQKRTGVGPLAAVWRRSNRKGENAPRGPSRLRRPARKGEMSNAQLCGAFENLSFCPALARRRGRGPA